MLSHTIAIVKQISRKNIEVGFGIMSPVEPEYVNLPRS